MSLAAEPWVPELPPGQDELPYEDGMPLETSKHREQMNLLIETIRHHLHPRTDVYVGGNLAVYYSLLQARRRDFLVPDVFAARDATPERQRKSWVVWEEEGHTPFLVIELLSESTEENDRGRKKEIYAGLNVVDYVLFDPIDLRLEVLRRNPDWEWHPVAPVDGVYPLASLPVGLAVREGTFQGVKDQWLRLIGADGRVVPTAEERAEAERGRAEAERGRAEAERGRAEAERERAERLLARLRAAGIDPEAG
jgi:Uma2 family endonuclease